MIKTRKDLKEYIQADLKRYPTPPRFASRILHTEKYFVWKQIKNLRLLEFYENNKRNVFYRILYYFQLVKYYRIMHKNQMYLYPNVFGPGLYVPHLGRILTPPNAKVGCNCTIRPGLLIATNLGVKNSKKHFITIGDNVEFSEDVKVLCKKIGNNVVVGPNTVVSCNIPDNKTVYAPICEIIDRDI